MDSDKRFLLLPDTLTTQEWTNYRFVMPTISVGQVGQLSVDLLLNNFRDRVRKIGTIYSDAVLPVAGTDRSGSGLCAALELHVCEDHRLVILQQRSPFVKGRIPAFRRKLLAWVKRVGFAETVVFGGVSSHIRKDAELEGSVFRFLTTSNEIREKCSDEFKWREYVITKEKEGFAGETIDETTAKMLAVPGSGILKSLYEDCTQGDVCFSAFLVFCNPGNTIHEAVQVVEHFRRFIGIGGGGGGGGAGDPCGKNLRIPASWNPPSDDIKSSYIF